MAVRDNFDPEVRLTTIVAVVTASPPPMFRRALTLATRRAALAPAMRPLHATAPRLAEEGAAGGMKFSFVMPEKSLYEESPVEMVIVPGLEGFFGLMPGHVPTIAELKPGVVSVQETVGGPLKKFFVPGGFATINADSVCNLTTLEAVEIDDLDEEAVKTGLAQYQAAYAAATEDMDKTEAEIGVDCYQAMAYAIAEK